MLPHVLLLTSLFLGTNGVFNLTIIHTNDMQGRIEEFSEDFEPCKNTGPCFGGFARVKFLADQIRRSRDNVLFLNTGDNFEGSALNRALKTAMVSEFINMLGFDAMCLGNHEFDEGPENLAEYLKKVKTPTVTSNIDYTNELSLKDISIWPWISFTLNGVQIAVVGYLTPDTKFLSYPGKVVFLDEIESIKKSAREAKERGAKLVIALGHSGDAKNREIAQKVPEIDIVVGGHSGTLHFSGQPPSTELVTSDYPTIVVQPSGKQVPVVEAFPFTKYLGCLDLTFDHALQLVEYSGNPILLDSTIEKDPRIEEALKPWKKQMINISCNIVGETRVALDSDCRSRECNFGNLLTDAMVHEATKFTNQLSWTMAPIALVNSGRIRTTISERKGYGFICDEDIRDAIPFPDNLLILQITGELLKEMLEISVGDYSHIVPKGRFLQMSGIRVVYNLQDLPMHRVRHVEVRCWNCTVPVYEPLSYSKTYRIVTTSFLWSGKHNYTFLRTAPVVESLGIPMNEALIRYVKTRSPVFPGLEGRIRLMNPQFAESRWLSYM